MGTCSSWFKVPANLSSRTVLQKQYQKWNIRSKNEIYTIYWLNNQSITDWTVAMQSAAARPFRRLLTNLVLLVCPFTNRAELGWICRPRGRNEQASDWSGIGRSCRQTAHPVSAPLRRLTRICSTGTPSFSAPSNRRSRKEPSDWLSAFPINTRSCPQLSVFICTVLTVCQYCLLLRLSSRCVSWVRSFIRMSMRTAAFVWTCSEIDGPLHTTLSPSWPVYSRFWPAPIQTRLPTVALPSSSWRIVKNTKGKSVKSSWSPGCTSDQNRGDSQELSLSSLATNYKGEASFYPNIKQRLP